MEYKVIGIIFTYAYVLNYLLKSALRSELIRFNYIILSVSYVYLLSTRSLIGDSPYYAQAWEAGDVEEFRSLFFIFLSKTIGFLSFVNLSSIVNLIIIFLLISLSAALGHQSGENIVIAYFVGSFSFLITTLELFKEALSLIFTFLLMLDLLKYNFRRSFVWAVLAAMCHPYSVLVSLLIYIASSIRSTNRIPYLIIWLIAVFFSKSFMITNLTQGEFYELFRIYIEGMDNVYILQPFQFAILVGSVMYIFLNERRSLAIREYSFWCLFINATLILLSYDYPDMARRFIYRMEIYTMPVVLIYLMSISAREIKLVILSFLAVFFTILLMNPNLQLIAQF